MSKNVGKEGWFALVYHKDNNPPTMHGIYDTREECEQIFSKPCPGRIIEYFKMMYNPRIRNA